MQQFTKEKLSVVVIGNSYAYDAANMLDLAGGFEIYYDGTTTNKCNALTLAGFRHRKQFAEHCARAKSKFERSYPGADIIVLGDHNSTWDPGNARWKRELRANLRALRIHGFRGPIVIYGERPVYRKHVFRLLLRFGRLNGIEKFAGGFLRNDIDTMRKRVDVATDYFKSLGIYYFSPVDQLCDEEICQVLSPDGRLLYFDSGHYSHDGLELLAPEFARYLRGIATQETAKRRKAPRTTAAPL